MLQIPLKQRTNLIHGRLETFGAYNIQSMTVLHFLFHFSQFVKHQLTLNPISLHLEILLEVVTEIRSSHQTLENCVHVANVAIVE
jgi:hypothetical protein